MLLERFICKDFCFLNEKRKMTSRKSQIWVSAVLYLTLGIVAISLLLAAAIPVINKMRDRNTMAQTKELMFTLDETIRTVLSEGPGSQRELSPFTIKSGYLFIDDSENKVVWTMETSAVLMEPNIQIQEGVLNMTLHSTKIEDKYNIELLLPYEGFIDIEISPNIANPLSGRYSLIIFHTGAVNADGEPIIRFNVI